MAQDGKGIMGGFRPQRDASRRIIAQTALHVHCALVLDTAEDMGAYAPGIVENAANAFIAQLKTANAMCDFLTLDVFEATGTAPRFEGPTDVRLLRVCDVRAGGRATRTRALKEAWRCLAKRCSDTRKAGCLHARPLIVLVSGVEPERIARDIQDARLVGGSAGGSDADGGDAKAAGGPNSEIVRQPVILTVCPAVPDESTLRMLPHDASVAFAEASAPRLSSALGSIGRSVVKSFENGQLCIPSMRASAMMGSLSQVVVYSSSSMQGELEVNP